MQQLNVLTDDADQLVTFPLGDGTTAQMEFFYRAGIQRWCMDLTHDALVLKGYTLTVGPNILRPWRKLIPFGICVLSQNGLDPILSTDFQSGNITVNMLSADEVAQVESVVLVPA